MHTAQEAQETASATVVKVKKWKWKSPQIIAQIAQRRTQADYEDNF